MGNKVGGRIRAEMALFRNEIVRSFPQKRRSPEFS